MKIFFKYYFPAIIWAVIIFSFSSIPGGEQHLETVYQVITRKGAHFIEFSILVFFIWRIFFFHQKKSLEKSYLFAFIFSSLYAASDEFHQTFIYGRAGKVIDAIFDIISMIFFLEVILICIKRKITWKNFIILLISLISLVGIELKMIYDGNKNNKLQEKEVVEIEKKEIVKNKKEDKETKKDDFRLQKQTKAKENESFPDNFLISVPFTSQAPFKAWDEIHEEACEEASIIMLKYFLDKKNLTPEIAEKEIQELVKFQNKKYGDFKDTTVEETVKLFMDFYSDLDNEKKLRVIYDFDKNDIKKYLLRGYPIIVPAAGRELKNPYFTPPGPLYHNLVLIGYENDIIITNDPGTKGGEGYEYDIDVLYNAIHDFTGNPEDIENGRRAMIIVE